MTGQPTTPDPAVDVPRPASPQLLALAAVARPDWDPQALRDALAHAHIDGVTWGQVLTAMGRLLADPEAEPADLLPAVPEAWRRRRPHAGADTTQRGAAAVRAALRDTTDPTSPTPDTDPDTDSEGDEWR